MNNNSSPPYIHAGLTVADCSPGTNPNYAKVNKQCQVLCRGHAPSGMGLEQSCGPNCAKLVGDEYEIGPCLTTLAAMRRGGKAPEAGAVLALDPVAGAPHTLQAAAYDGFCFTAQPGRRLPKVSTALSGYSSSEVQL